MRPVFATIILLLCAVAPIVVAAQDRIAAVRSAVDRRDYESALTELASLRYADSKSFEINNLDYLNGRLEMRVGDIAGAVASFQRVAASRSVLRPYALFHLSRLFRSSGNLLLERLCLQELLTVAPDSLLAEAASIRLARSYFDSRDYDAAIRQISITGIPNGGGTNLRRRENLVLVAEAQMHAGRASEARAIFQSLIVTTANPEQPDDFALAGVIGLDKLDTGPDFGLRAPLLSAEDHFQRAMIYQFNRDFADARLHLRAIVDRFPESGIVPDAMFHLGRGLAQTSDYKQALEWFDRILDKFPDHMAANDALTNSAGALSRLGDHQGAIRRYRSFIDRYPNDERLDRAYLNIVDVLRDAGDDSGAIAQATLAEEVFRGKTAEAVALFAKLRIRVSGADWPAAIADSDRLLTLGDLGGTRVPGGTVPAEVKILRAVAFENLERFDEAIAELLSIPDGRDEYHGWRATERLRALTQIPAASFAVERVLARLRLAAAAELTPANADAVRKAAQSLYRIAPDQATLERIDAAYRLIPEYRVTEVDLTEPAPRGWLSAEAPATVVGELLFLGLLDEWFPEWEFQRKSRPASDLSSAVLAGRSGFPHLSVAFAEPIWRRVPSDFEIRLIPRSHTGLLYPAAFADDLLKHSKTRGVDPRFMLSIMRQESRFRTDVKSFAAARGLMQFISTTSNRIAKDLGRAGFSQDELYDPETSVLFGSHYVAELFGHFRGKSEAVAASYNGGEDNMKRWLLRSRDDSPDRYVPEVIFAQSKDYVWKVGANYRVYTVLYDETMNRK